MSQPPNSIIVKGATTKLCMYISKLDAFLT